MIHSALHESIEWDFKLVALPYGALQS